MALEHPLGVDRPFRVGVPHDEVRFALTSEAGLNDALAFPFVHAAIALSLAGAGMGWSSGFRRLW